MPDQPQLVRARFEAAVRAFAQRTDLMPKDKFLKLQEFARARSWTVARVQDMDLLRDLFDTTIKTIDQGGTFRDFLGNLESKFETLGWSGKKPWHTELVYDQNLAMSFSAGRHEQAKDAGVKVWRYLESTAQNPREDHKKFYGKLYPIGEGPQPPLDYGCQCSWEVVFEDDDDFDPSKVENTDGPPVPSGQEFQFSPASFRQPVKVKLSDYPKELQKEIRRLSRDDPSFQVDLEG